MAVWLYNLVGNRPTGRELWLHGAGGFWSDGGLYKVIMWTLNVERDSEEDGRGWGTGNFMDAGEAGWFRLSLCLVQLLVGKAETA
jgi:hypothetical protein